MMSRRCLDGAAGGRSQPLSSPSSRRVRRSDSLSDDDDDDDDDTQDVSSSRRVACPLEPAAGAALRRPNNCHALRSMCLSIV